MNWDEAKDWPEFSELTQEEYEAFIQGMEDYDNYLASVLLGMEQ